MARFSSDLFSIGFVGQAVVAFRSVIAKQHTVLSRNVWSWFSSVSFSIGFVG